MVNVSPMGRNVSLKERAVFIEFNKKQNVLNKIAQTLTKEFGEDLKFSVGGQISVDFFPHGWDKTYCLKFVNDLYGDIHFFGDKCYEGGNDFEIFKHERTKGNWVKNGPHETIELLEKLYVCC